MNLGQMQSELTRIIEDDGLRERLVGWINDAILEIATNYDLPPLALADPYSLTVDTSTWLCPLPATFHKNLFMAKFGRKPLTIYKNPAFLSGKDHTIVRDQVNEVVVIPRGSKFYLGVYPLAEHDIDLWFYQKPAILKTPDDVCDCIPPNFISSVIYPKLIIKNFQVIVDQVIDFPISAGSLQYWQNELTRGLHGGTGYGPGLLGYFNLNYHPPRRTGGRDPIGGRPYSHGSF